MRCTVLAFVLASVATGASAQESGPPTFSVAAELVSVTATVTDGRGKYITDLTRENFVILEDGIPQKLELFEPESTPIDLIVMIDASGSMTSMTPMGTSLAVAKKSAKSFIRSLRPDDRVMVTSFSDRLYLKYEPGKTTPFTNNSEFLETSIDSITIENVTCLYNSIYDVLKSYLPRRNPEHPRRTVIVILSDGEDTCKFITDEQVTEQARVSGATIYTIEMPHLDVGRDAVQRISYANHFLTGLARKTGGATHVLQTMKGLTNAYTVIGQELQLQYRLGYQSTNPKTDGKWRVIEIRSAVRGGLTIRHRLGYHAPKRRMPRPDPTKNP